MVRGIKVKGQAHLVRSAAIPGLILSNNTEAARAALQGRVNQEAKDQLIEDQAIQIAQLQSQMQAVLEFVGVPDSLKPAETEDKEDGQ